MKETSKTIQKWHEESFPDVTLNGQFEKFKEELREYMAAQTDEEKLFELADMAIAVMGGIRRFDEEYAKELIFMVYEDATEDGFDMMELWDAIQKKMEINRRRKWTKKEGQYKHVEE